MQNSKKIHCDYLVIGAGLIGSSVAMHLAEFLQGKNKNILVVDIDLEGIFSSSELNAGGARATWDQSVNIELAKESIQFLEKNKSLFGYRDCGYFWLFDEKKWINAKKRAQLIEKKGWPVELFERNQIPTKVPFLDKLDDVGGASFTPKDGLFNPNLLKKYFRDEARKRGVSFMDGCFIQRSLFQGDTHHVEAKIVSVEEKIVKNILSSNVNIESNSTNLVQILAKNVVNCAGAWAANIAKIFAYECSSIAVRRQVSVFSNKEIDMNHYGMIVDSSGVYFHPEANNILAGFADPEEKPGYNLNYDGISFFEEKIWMPLYQRSSKFESLKHITGWGGLYEVSPDYSGIIGNVDGKNNLYECHSFSGRGAMQSYAAGKGLAELIAFHQYQSIDLAALSGKRFSENKLIPEGLHI